MDIQTAGACFNTQPPEGGWARNSAFRAARSCFNTQPPEGGWQNTKIEHIDQTNVSTHSRPKAAGG